MKIPFTKMHGIGNDYIYVNCMDGELPDPAGAAIAMSPRHFSVGGDGLVMICASQTADAKMRMFNADGSEGNMCGNAIRCVGKYLYDNHIVNETEISIETRSGIKHLHLTVKDGAVVSVTVDMGYASFAPADIPIAESQPHINAPITVEEKPFCVTCVSMGNPHAVVYRAEIDSLPLDQIGPVFEHHALFPERVNTEFVRILSPSHLQMRVWERGSGETWACGTGACAVVAASVKNGISPINTPITVSLIGGDLIITCDDHYRITMCGEATKVYDGVYEYEN